MKRLLTALVLLAGAISVHAVTPNPYTLEVGMSFTVVSSPGSGGAQLNVTGETSVGVGLSLPGSGQSAESYHATVPMRPGKVYTSSFMTTGAAPAPYNMGFTAPDGYAVFVNGVRMDQYYIYTNPPWNYYWGTCYAYFNVQILPITGNMSAPAGSFSGITTGKSVTWQVGLGGLRNGSGAGVVMFRESDLTNSPVSRARLYYTAAANSNQITSVYDGTGLRQVMTPQTLADLVDDGGGNGYWIKFYTPSQGTWNGSSYTVSGSPWRTIRVESPGTNQMKITETEGSVSRVSSLALTSGTVSTGTYQWTLQEGDNSTWLRTTTHSSTNNGGTPSTRDDVVIIRTGGTGGTVVAKTKYRYTTQAWGEEVTQVTADPDTAALVTTYAYHTNSSALGNYGKVQSVTDPTGNWTSYVYYDDWNRRGQLQTESHPWMDSPSTAQSASSSVGNSVTYDYSSDYSGRYTIPTSKQSYVTTTGTTQTGKQLSTRTLISPYYTRLQSNAYSSSSSYQTSTVEIFDPRVTNPDYYNLPVSVKRPDQTQDSFVYHTGSYSSGTFTSPGDGTHMRTIVFHGSTNSSGAQSFSSYGGRTVQTIYMVPNKSTADVTIKNAAGLVVRTEKWIYTGSGNFTTVSNSDMTYDSAGRLTQSAPSNGAIVDNTYTNGRLHHTNGVDNTETDYTYDGLGRILTTKKVGYSVSGYTLPGDITTTYTYDGSDHVTQQQVTGGSSTVTSTAQFDLAGRQTQAVQYSTVSSNSITTGTAYSSGGRIVDVTLPGPNSPHKITEAYLDGQLKQVSGSGVVQQNASYSIESGTGNIKTATYAGGVSAATVTTTADWLGRKITVVKPAWSDTGTPNWATYNWYYNTSGQLWKQTAPGVAPTLYTYDTLGQLSREGLDIDSDSALVPALSDRIIDHGWTYFTDSVNWWLRETTSTYPQDNNGTAKQTGKTETLVTLPGTVLNFRYSWDIYGNQTANYQILNRSAHLISTITDVPDSTYNAEQWAYNGYTVWSRDTANVLMKFGYDALGRQNKSIDPRTGASGAATTTAFIAGTNLVSTVTDPANTVQATYAYDHAGRVISVMDAASKYAYTSYKDRGEVWRKWGQTTDPVEYGYDDSGRQTTMKTYATSTADFTTSTWPSSPNNPQTTTWNYQAASGLLSSKVDANSKSVTFSYTTAGQPYQRTWARNVTTTYGYYSTTGELYTVGYSDGSATNLTYTYNRLGKVATVADHGGTHTFNYNLAGTLELQSEDLGSYFGTKRLTYGYSASGVVGRPDALKLGTSSNPTADQSVTYDYQSDGRFYSLAASGQTFTYGYQSNSHLVSTVSNSGFSFTDTRGYDPYHDWVDSRATTVSSSNKATFAYTQDTMGRVTDVAKTGELFNRYGNGTEGLTTTYGYDAKSQLSSDVTKVGTGSTILTGRDDSEYLYDNLGNRTTVKHNSSTVTSSYTTNLLNQYTQRTVAGVFDVAGAATSGTTVTVSKPGGPSDTATPHGQYFFDGYSLTNTSTAAYTSLTVSVNGTPQTPTLPAFVAKTPEAFTYDLDGNLTDDGRWHYTYDAENRLLTVETTAAAVTAGVPKQYLGFAYDYMGRRIAKIAQSGWNGTAYTVTDYYAHFIYNGWNPIAEINGSTGALLRSFFWGMDIAGPGQRAGGIGGLLMIKDGSTNYVPAYDGMGNLHALIKTSDGSIAAAYEYDAYGQTIRETGTYAAYNPFRYSTKFTDVETGLIYYGKRYYSPSLGRFINRDPIEEAGGVNLYGFCANNAVNLWDHLGMGFGRWLKKLFSMDGGGPGSAANARDALWNAIPGAVVELAPFEVNVNATKARDNGGFTKIGTATIGEHNYSVWAGDLPSAPNSGGGLTFGDKARIILGVANAVSPNPVASAIDQGIATTQLTGSVYAGVNAAVNPAYGVIAGSYEAGTGMSLNPDTAGQTLTTGGRILSGFSAGLNAVSLVGVGVGGAKLLAPSLTPANSLWGANIGWKGGEITFTVPGKATPDLRINPTGDWSSTNPNAQLPHFHSRPGIGWHRPWEGPE